MNIGFNIRHLRLKKKITQKQLAQKLNVTSGYISQIENNLISPSIKVLFSLLEILKISPSDFFKKQEKNIELIHKSDDFFGVLDENLKNKIYYLFPKMNNSRMKPLIIEIQSQGQTNIKSIKNDEDVFVFVLEGEVILVLNKCRYFLKKNETFYLSTDKEYYLFNYRSEKARILQINSLSSSLE
ncbi:helix-turn-helix domain-containing protein [Texas Phoenix palm phytoplasma]|uniref:Helix-turn-helix domain-containing protein n=1 Tax=Texas Phoenix palm phytoplasma TaxID=176709 RepID=A0ABS5BI49_9MOLU|nr:helix-turn-helix domain-containing protein [Texas Phoenix palm phytoplasma]MBP3059258.1 helix-turn-helix domain-containing protein [Texas Phoenix palm phytoplasma]